MRKLTFCFYLAASIVGSYCSAASKAIIIDHNCLKIDKIPAKYIKKAKKDFRIAYGHTSHGSQLISGMQALAKVNSLYKYSSNKKSPEAFLWDRIPSGDLGNPNQEAWADKTREMLKSFGKNRNLVIWSWCGQAGRKSTNIDKYLQLMSQLEKEFPNVTFVYMTGHLNGSGPRGTLHKNNEKIREFCKKNGKVLFDFADIESYDPDGKINYNELYCRDNCEYRKGRIKYNWAKEWLTKNPDHKFAMPKRAAHTHPLNGAMKGQAFWWMMAKLAGWKN